MLNFASICPHPPLIIPNIGKEKIERVAETTRALDTLAQEFEQRDPETVIVVSPHAPIESDTFLINKEDPLQGNFHQFGDLTTELTFPNDLELVEKINEEATGDIPIRTATFGGLDHGSLVPLYYLAQGKPDLKVVTLAYSELDLETHFELGQILRKAARDKKVGIVASGDLSHRLNKNARKFSRREGLSSSGYSPKHQSDSSNLEDSSHPPRTAGEEFDRKLIELLKEKDVEGILNMDSTLVREAGQCGYRSIVILLGALRDLDWEPQVLSYQGPFGVGYLVAQFDIEDHGRTTEES